MSTSHDLQSAAGAERIALLVLTAAAMVTAIAVVWLFDPLKINPDTMQLIDTARHLVAGQGLTSGIVYYDAQRAFEQVPAPMIIWPPGFPWLLAAGMSVGLSAEATALASCLAAHIATTFLIYFGLRRVGASAAVAAVVGLVWLTHPTALSLTISCFAEPIYTAFTLASWLALIKALGTPQRWRAWLIASGALAALAVLMRYTGVLWPAAAGLWLAFLALRQRSWRPIGLAIAFGALPAITTLALFWRNYTLNGELSGGQFDYGGSAGVGEVLRRFYWGTDLLFGSTLTSHSLALGAVFAVLGLAIVQLALTLRSSEPRGLLVGLSLTKTIFLAVFLFINALRSSIVFVDYRYWMPAMPFMLMVIGLVADSAVSKLRAASATRAKAWPGVVAFAAAALAVSVFIAFGTGWPYTQPHPSTEVVARALTEKLVDGRPLASVLSGSADSPRLLLSNEERRLGYVAHVAVVGLPIARYTQHVWTSDSVAGIVSKFGISHVLFFPSTYEAEFKNPFYEDLREGRQPDWLTVSYRGERFVLYQVVPERLPR
jgi:hypothetical protein